jgi:ABC-type glutathione transport system ATPase component
MVEMFPDRGAVRGISPARSPVRLIVGAPASRQPRGMAITRLQTRIPAVALDGVTKTYEGGGAEVVRALDDVSLAFESGTFSAIMGASGSGKTTLLQCAAGLDRPDRGTVRIGATDLTGLGERRLAQLRRRSVGFVFQSFNLLPSLTARRTPPCRCGSPASIRAGASLAMRSRGSGSPIAPGTDPRSSRAASSSAWRSHAR